MIILKNKKCDLTIFAIGAIGYGLIELMWRGRTHPSMLFAGGVSFLGLSKISHFMKKAFVGCALITAIEYVFGIFFNVILKRKVWDYSKMKFNLGGQICALYSFFWLILSFLFIPLADKIKNKVR